MKAKHADNSPECHTSTPPTSHLNRGTATLELVQSVVSETSRCGISPAKVQHWGR
ncbi:hypothetical protein [Bacteroides sp.]|uniref:hypothetical protein n=1 Tax=Bacteroides sp. TaxID=29523 RepID=UPI003A94B8FD